MAAESQNNSPFSSWRLLILIAGALGLFFPTARELPTHPTAAVGEMGIDELKRISAELWEDPYGEISRKTGENEQKSLATGSNQPGEAKEETGLTDANLPEELKTPRKTEKDKCPRKICILPVVVRGSLRLPEAKEMRVRFRTAVISGLGANGMVPNDPSHLLLFQTTLGKDGKTDRNPAVPMAAEWFVPGRLPRSTRPTYDAVLVVWVPDHALFAHPLRNLSELCGKLQGKVTSSLCGEAPAFDNHVVGPYWSGILIDMLKEKLEPAPQPVELTFYSATATMADGLLDRFVELNAAGPEVQGRSRPLGGEWHDHFHFINLTATDEQLADALIRELYLRGVDVTDHDTRIALVSDWDTDYGRALPLTFAAKVQQWIERHQENGTRPTPGAPPSPTLPAAKYSALEFDRSDQWPWQVARAYYLSGVSGTLTSSGEAKSKESDKAEGGPNRNLVTLQHAEGEHQVDYIARLGRALESRFKERDLQGGREASKLRAIGVFGPDICDKLLLIQTLRPLFKDAVFFTDAMDARLLDPMQALPTTRNLVVVAPYGLELTQHLQVGIPPFRSSEQTGTFFAAMLATSHVDEASVANFQEQLGQPVRFEIGRTGAVRLLIPGHSTDSELTPPPADRMHGRIHPDVPTPLPHEKGFWDQFAATYVFDAFAIIALGATVIFVFHGRLPRWRPQAAPGPKEDESEYWVIWTLKAAGVVLVVCALVFIFYDGVEPASFTDGVSLWPSEFIRLLALAWCVESIKYCYSRARRARENLGNAFSLAPASSGPESKATKEKEGLLSRKLWASFFTSAQGDGVCKPAESLKITEIWERDRKQADNSKRTTRVVAMSLLYFIGWLCVLASTGWPTVPHRGAYSFICDRLATLGAGLALIYLIFWVIDETHLCLRFVKTLGCDAMTDWGGADKKVNPSAVTVNNHVRWRRGVSSYLDVDFIGQLTESSILLIILPFVGLTLMIFSRWDLFANWHANPLVVAGLMTNAALCIICAVLLRNAAVDAKSRAVRAITVEAAALQADPKTTDAGEALLSLRQAMIDNDAGAYRPWYQQPFLTAFLIPLGSSGGLNLIEYFMSK